MRILGFIQIAGLTVTNLALKRRLPPKNVAGPFFDLTAFKDMRFTVYCSASFISFLGLYTVCSRIYVFNYFWNSQIVVLRFSRISISVQLKQGSLPISLSTLCR